MKKKSYAKQVAEDYISENLENSKIVNFLDANFNGLEIADFASMNQIDFNGFPFSSDFVDEKGKSYNYIEAAKLSKEQFSKLKYRYFYLPKYHELYVGTTGSGKTTGCIEPQIRAVARQKNKPNFFVTDPKGELFENHARFLKENDYNIFILNFKDFSRSNRWNPLKEMYDEQMKILNIGKNVQVKNGKPDSEIKLMSIDYKDQYYEYQGMAFSSQDEVDAYANTEAFLLKSKISSLINSFCTTVIPPSNANDRTWEDGARGLLNGIIQCMLEEALNPERGFTAEMMSLKSVLDCFMLFREMSLSSSPYQDIAEDIVNFYLKDKPVEALNNIYNVLHTAPVTMKGFYSSFASLVNKWMQGHIFQLTSDTNFDLDDTSKPWAIFICTKDYDKSDNVIAGLFIDWVYRQCLNKSEELIQKNQPIRATHFLLDEFANIPKIPDFENKIATARSRNIWFHLYVQAYEQLDSVYGDKISKIIIDNCNVQVFLGSQSLDSKTKFSSECGKKNIVSVHGILTGNNAELTEVPVLPITALDLIKPGELYIKRIYEPVIKGEFIRSYQLALLDVFKYYHDKNAYKDIAPLNNASPNDSKHSYPLFNFRTYKIPYNIEDDDDDDDDSTW